MHFYGLQPSELRALTMNEIEMLAKYRDDYMDAERDAYRG